MSTTESNIRNIRNARRFGAEASAAVAAGNLERAEDLIDKAQAAAALIPGMAGIIVQAETDAHDERVGRALAEARKVRATEGAFTVNG